VADAIKQAMGSFVSFTFSTKFVFRVNQILTVIAVVQIQNFRQAFMSKSYVAKCKYLSRTHRFLNLTVPDMKIIGVRRRSIRPNIIPVPCIRAILQRSLGVRNYPEP
jgi:hypothetical protein